jgi:glutathione S-transferase
MWELYPFSIIMTLIMMAYLFFLSAKVGAARGKYDVKAPDCVGPDEFNRVFRVHQNTQEQLILFLPLFVLFVIVGGDKWAAPTAVIWMVGRLIYRNSYLNNPASRAPGMLLTALAPALCFIGVIAFAIMRQMGVGI